MGAFLIHESGIRPGGAFRDTEDLFAAMGFVGVRRLSLGDGATMILGASPTCASGSIVELPSGDFAAAFGTFCWRRRLGRAALSAFLEDFSGDASILDHAIGHFALVVRQRGQVSVLGDRAGAFTIFCAPGIVSSSFLGAALAVPAATLATQEAYEYVLHGAVTGNATLVQEVRVLPRYGAVVVQQGRVALREPPAPVFPEPSSLSFERLVDDGLARLDAWISDVRAAFGSDLCCAMTGGYDSRLLFALLQRNGVSPRLIMYGSAGNEEVEIARAVAEGEGVRLLVIDRKVEEPRERTAFHDRFICADGSFDTDSEATERLRRAGSGAFLHGGAGEVLRDFFMLGHVSLDCLDVARSFWVKFDSRLCAAHFDVGEHLQSIAEKMSRIAGSPGPFPRQAIEWFYPNFRCKAWFGRESSLNNLAAPSLMPFYEAPFMDWAGTIAVDRKRAGAFEAALIHRISPEIASYPSQYGHSFEGPPPVARRVRDALKSSVPVALRPTLFGLRARIAAKRGILRGWHKTAEIAAMFPNGFPVASRLFNLDFASDPPIRSRIMTVEYLAEWLGSKLCSEGDV